MAIYMNEHIYCNRSLYSVILEDSRFTAKYVTACLNSKTLQYYYQICFKAESELFPKIRIAQAKLLPIAPIDMQIQNDIGRLVDDYICAKEQEKASIQKRIDAKIYGLFGLTNDEITIIENAVSPVR